MWWDVRLNQNMLTYQFSVQIATSLDDPKKINYSAHGVWRVYLKKNIYSAKFSSRLQIKEGAENPCFVLCTFSRFSLSASMLCASHKSSSMIEYIRK